MTRASCLSPVAAAVRTYHSVRQGLLRAKLGAIVQIESELAFNLKVPSQLSSSFGHFLSQPAPMPAATE